MFIDDYRIHCHQIFCCNYLALAAALADKSADASIFDPPYLEHTHTSQRRGATGMVRRGAERVRRVTAPRPVDFTHITAEARALYAAAIGRTTKGWALVHTDHDGYDGWKSDLQIAGADRVQQLVWVRGAEDIANGQRVTKGSMGAPQLNGEHPAAGHELIALAWFGKGRMRWNGRGAARDGSGGLKGGGSVYYAEIERASDGRPDHDTPKPLGLMRQFVREFTKPGDLIVDGFCGSGTTLLAAKIEGRFSIGCDVVPKHAASSARRLGVEVR